MVTEIWGRRRKSKVTILRIQVNFAMVKIHLVQNKTTIFGWYLSCLGVSNQFLGDGVRPHQPECKRLCVEFELEFNAGM